MNAPLPAQPRERRTDSGLSLIPLLIAVVVVTVVAVPVVLVSYSKARQRTRIFDDINAAVTDGNDLKAKLRTAYKNVRRAGTIPNAESILHRLDEQFQTLFRASYDLRKRQDSDAPPTVEELLAMKRDLGDYVDRVRTQYDRIHHLEQLSDVGETSLQLARFFQRAVDEIRRRVPFEGNERVVPQLVEAGRQLQTGMNFVFSGFTKFTDDAKGDATPTLVKTGIEQIRRVTDDIRTLIRQLRGLDGVQMNDPASRAQTLADYVKHVLTESDRRAIPPLPERRDTARAAGPPSRRSSDFP